MMMTVRPTTVDIEKYHPRRSQSYSHAVQSKLSSDSFPVVLFCRFSFSVCHFNKLKLKYYGYTTTQVTKPLQNYWTTTVNQLSVKARFNH